MLVAISLPQSPHFSILYPFNTPQDRAHYLRFPSRARHPLLRRDVRYFLGKAGTGRLTIRNILNSGVIEILEF